MNEELEIPTMRIIQDIQENDMVAAFLRAEVDSYRFGPLLADQLRNKKISPSILRKPDVRNDTENQTRADLLSESRGYRRNASLFHGFPDDCQWKLVAITKSDLDNTYARIYPKGVKNHCRILTEHRSMDSVLGGGLKLVGGRRIR